MQRIEAAKPVVARPHPVALTLKFVMGGLFVAPAVAIWAVCAGLALLWIGGRRSAAHVIAALAPVPPRATAVVIPFPLPSRAADR